jgi:hypothetical protein
MPSTALHALLARTTTILEETPYQLACNVPLAGTRSLLPRFAFYVYSDIRITLLCYTPTIPHVLHAPWELMDTMECANHAQQVSTPIYQQQHNASIAHLDIQFQNPLNVLFVQQVPDQVVVP